MIDEYIWGHDMMGQTPEDGEYKRCGLGSCIFSTRYPAMVILSLGERMKIKSTMMAGVVLQ
jgi:hypothetical protein